MTVLVTGAGGQLGRAALRELGADGIGLRRADLDVTDAAAVLAAAQQHQPTLILHAAAWTDVDGAETDRDGAYRANVLANRHVAEAAKAVGARLVTLSTDFVFAGHKREPYVESDATGPISRLIMRLSETRDVLRVVEDQVGSPTYAGHLAPLLLGLTNVVPAGIHHIAGSGAATRREWAEAVLAAAGRTTVVEGATSDEFPTPAERPSYSALGSERAETPVLLPWRAGVAACMAGYVA
ncbi:MAG: NAD(P)-dependent oxidoreductase [Actinobacteria bacterium]|nr:NAD(P)-dependent oxidoreductase [Actinomycetota bacterium]